MNDKLERDVTYVKSVGPKKAEVLARVGIKTVYDLLQYCPRDYVDLSEPSEIRTVTPNDERSYVIRGRIASKLPPSHIRKGMTLCKAVVTDDTDDITLTLFNQEYTFANLREGDDVVLYGKVTGNAFRREMSSPLIFPANTPDLIIPVYPLTNGLTQNAIRKAVKSALDLVEGEVEDVMPPAVRESAAMCTQYYAWENVHFPKSMIGAHEARRRLIFDELFVHSLAIGYSRSLDNVYNSCPMEPVTFHRFEDVLPFKLTNAQKKALVDIATGLCGKRRMNRLLQGDVGSGKTAVAAGAAYFAFMNGYQSCMMAPTEILAAQHYKTFRTLLEPLGIRVGLLTGSLTPKNKRAVQESAAAGELDCLIGTHALFSENTAFKRLGLVMTDEQHRFGVEQRAALSAKGSDPHRLTMSATPIPRTLALIFYGDLEISVLDELPKGRMPVATYAVTGKVRERAYGFVKKQLDMGHQGYIVCPAVDESGLDIIDAKSYYEKLAQGAFADYRLGLLHGRMNGAEKEEVMELFKAGEIDLLVATTVIEVGVDVPNATIIVIENADRFGLSQLHQLRGRVGRGGHESFCVLITDNTSPDNVKRMKTISSTTDGFRIAEEDLKLRGPGDFFGTNQHGLPTFKIADLTRDVNLLETAQKLSKRFLDADPRLEKPENAVLRELVGKIVEGAAEMN